MRYTFVCGDCNRSYPIGQSCFKCAANRFANAFPSAKELTKEPDKMNELEELKRQFDLFPLFVKTQNIASAVKTFGYPQNRFFHSPDRSNCG